ncbi:winged helix-turn-helix domain-containing protein [Streptacidiphilus cavernicola]|uniref:Winged helix-turn-helix domain-containing protein n=1 Tax=Streptacidiphilus cavernicola TaxID=3342716 RepID=A0ABV6W419_9ACTN
MDNVPLADPRALRAYAHPIRLALVGLLRRQGPFTATRAAELTGESVASCSYHLRMLAKYGLVAEAEGGQGREKPWRATSHSTSWPGYSADPAVASAVGALNRAMVERYFAEMAHWLDRSPTEPPEWQQAAPLGDETMYLTADELARLGEAFRELLRPYAERLERPELRPEGSRRVSYVQFAHPVREVPDQAPQ